MTNDGARLRTEQLIKDLQNFFDDYTENNK